VRYDRGMNRPLSQIARYVLAALLTFALTLACWALGGLLTLANAVVLHLLLILIIAIRLRTAAALIASIAAVLAINYFLVEPRYTFTIYNPTEVVDLIVFGIVSLIAGQLGARVRAEAENARQRAHEQEILYRLASAFNQITTPVGVHEVLVRAMREDFAAYEARILPDQTPPLANIDANVFAKRRDYYFLLQAGATIYGTVCATFSAPLNSPQMRVIQTCVIQAAMALQRIGLVEQARKTQEYEAADRLKTAILHAVSHDLRTPITVIKTSASNLRRLDDKLTPQQRTENAQAIEGEADHLDELVGNLLDMSRLQAGALTLNKRLNALDEVIGDAAARLYQITKQERIKITLPEDLPLIPFDYGLILQALTNLTINAVRHEPPQSQVEISACVQEDQAQIQVVDHGEGVAADKREAIMQPFYRGREGHIGLGLPIAKGIVEAHGGRLIIQDTPGGGATFVITLPLKL
jgi:two-component system, OmpR family, sensor histidine kinase KdpD